MKKIDNKEIVDVISMLFQFGINMIVPIIICIALGIWIGNRYQMEWVVVPFFFIGAIAGYTSIFKMVKKYLKQKDTGIKKDVKKD